MSENVPDYMLSRLMLGIDEPLNEFLGLGRDDINLMRSRIANALRDSALIRNWYNASLHAGLSGEDRYVVLAYRALIELERVHVQLQRFIMLSADPLPHGNSL